MRKGDHEEEIGFISQSTDSSAEEKRMIEAVLNLATGLCVRLWCREPKFFIYVLMTPLKKPWKRFVYSAFLYIRTIMKCDRHGESS